MFQSIVNPMDFFMEHDTKNQQELIEKAARMLAVLLVAHIDEVQKDKGRKLEGGNQDK